MFHFLLVFFAEFMKQKCTFSHKCIQLGLWSSFKVCVFLFWNFVPYINIHSSLQSQHSVSLHASQRQKARNACQTVEIYPHIEISNKTTIFFFNFEGGHFNFALYSYAAMYLLWRHMAAMMTRKIIASLPSRPRQIHDNHFENFT